MTTEETIIDFENKLAACETDEERCEAYWKYTRNLWDKDVAKAKVYNTSYLSLAEKIGSDKHLLFAHQFTAIAHSVAGEIVEALNHINQSLVFAKQSGEISKQANLYAFIGSFYFHIRMYDEAIENYLTSIALSNSIGEKSPTVFVHCNLAVTYTNAGMFDKAEEILLKLEQEGVKNLPLYASLSGLYYEMNDFVKSEEYLHAMEDCITEGGLNRDLIAVYCRKMSLCIKRGKFEQSKEYITKAKRLAEQSGNIIDLIIIHADEAEAFYGMRQFREAEACYMKLLDLAKQYGVKQTLADTILSIIQFYGKQQNFERAFNYSQEYRDLDKELKKESVRTMQLMLDVKQKFAVSQKEKEITEAKNKELEEKNLIIAQERDRSETLLLNILPNEVAGELKAKGTAAAKLFDDVTVIYTDFVGFTTVSERFTPQQLVDELNVCFRAFDEITDRYHIEKIKTMGDAFIAVAGLPTANPNHAEDMVKAALEIREFVKGRKQELGENTFDIRIGVNSGSVVAGIVGVKKYAYDIWGDTVNTAARMEQNSEAGKVNISEATYELVKDQFTCEYRGEIEAKNKGKMKMYFVE